MNSVIRRQYSLEQVVAIIALLALVGLLAYMLHMHTCILHKYTCMHTSIHVTHVIRCLLSSSFLKWADGAHGHGRQFIKEKDTLI